MVRKFCMLTALAVQGVACARQDTGPRVGTVPVTDVVMRAEGALIESRVPRHATLDSLLRQHQLSGDLVNAAVRSATSVFNPRHIRADRPYRLVLSVDGFL